MLSPEQNKELVLRFMDEVFAKKNIAYLDEALSEDFIEHQVMPGISPDKAGARKIFEMMFQGTPDMSVEVTDVIASGDRVATNSIVRGTDTGGAMPGLPATNKPYSMGGIDIVRIDDEGKMAEHWGIVDIMGMMGQLGLLPQPRSA